jgi:hypothetical protein
MAFLNSISKVKVFGTLVTTNNLLKAKTIRIVEVKLISDFSNSYSQINFFFKVQYEFSTSKVWYNQRHCLC